MTVWMVGCLTGRRAAAERVQALLAREGFPKELRGERVYEVVVPEAEARDAQEVIQRV